MESTKPGLIVTIGFDFVKKFWYNFPVRKKREKRRKTVEISYNNIVLLFGSKWCFGIS